MTLVVEQVGFIDCCLTGVHTVRDHGCLRKTVFEGSGVGFGLVLGDLREELGKQGFTFDCILS